MILIVKRNPAHVHEDFMRPDGRSVTLNRTTHERPLNYLVIYQFNANGGAAGHREGLAFSQQGRGTSGM